MAEDFDEYDLFESQYADDLEALDEFEANPIDEGYKEEVLPSIEPNNKRRKLFSHQEDDEIQTVPIDPDSSLIIDEDIVLLTPKPKRPRKEKRNPSMPTTLDVDRDSEQLRQEALQRKNCVSSTQMIEKILMYRHNKHEAKDFMQPDLPVKPTFHINKVLVCPPMHSDFMSATSSDGLRVYMRLRSHDKITKVSNVNELITGSRSTQLLPYSLTELRQMIYEKHQMDALVETQRITGQVRQEALGIADSTLANAVLSEQSMVEDTPEDEGIYSGEETGHDALWVNKFAPKHYTHLLSDESVNRSLLKWLKLWDCVVFGRELRSKKKQDKENETNTKKFVKGKFGKPFKSTEPEEEMDEFKRPSMKTALLCGPPGLGKTTLAHVIAHHAGYHVVEMNASDDRSAEVFKKKLEETTQMKSVLGSDHRPNCLIIDEIDGAPQAAINVLLNAINQGKKTEANSKKTKKNSRNLLLRPIICICNDLYAPALRQLRQQSYVLQFPPTTTARLASRLRQLCQCQSLECDLSSILALCEKSGNDIRACINTLQFVKTKGNAKLSLEMVKDLSIGQKDQHKSVFHTWNEIFQLPKSKRKMDRDSQTVQHGVMDGQKVSLFSTRFYHIVNVVISNGEYEKTLQGVYENFLSMKFKDLGMSSINKAYQWLALYDNIAQYIASNQDWILMRYVPYLFVVYHLLFSCVAPPKIQFPQSANENRQKLQKSENLLSSLYMDMFPMTRCFTPPCAAVLDLVPHLLVIMSPSLRPVNMQLYSAAEKKQLTDLVQSMLAYNLTYRQERDEEGQYRYALEPKMSEVCCFIERTGNARRNLSYATKQIISREVESERMRRSERLMMRKSKVREEVPTKKPPAQPGAAVPNHLQRLSSAVNSLDIPKEKPVVDFFSRFTKIKKVVEEGVPAVAKAAPMRDPGIGNSHLWFKYNEGASNAVRRTMHVRDFM